MKVSPASGAESSTADANGALVEIVAIGPKSVGRHDPMVLTRSRVVRPVHACQQGDTRDR